MGHSIQVAAHHILRDGVSYRDLGVDTLDRLAKDQLPRRYLHGPEQLAHHQTLDTPPQPLGAPAMLAT